MGAAAVYWMCGSSHAKSLAAGPTTLIAVGRALLLAVPVFVYGGWVECHRWLGQGKRTTTNIAQTG